MDLAAELSCLSANCGAFNASLLTATAVDSCLVSSSDAEHLRACEDACHALDSPNP